MLHAFAGFNLSSPGDLGSTPCNTPALSRPWLVDFLYSQIYRTCSVNLAQTSSSPFFTNPQKGGIITIGRGTSFGGSGQGPSSHPRSPVVISGRFSHEPLENPMRLLQSVISGSDILIRAPPIIIEIAQTRAVWDCHAYSPPWHHHPD